MAFLLSGTCFYFSLSFSLLLSFSITPLNYSAPIFSTVGHNSFPFVTGLSFLH